MYKLTIMLHVHKYILWNDAILRKLITEAELGYKL